MKAVEDPEAQQWLSADAISIPNWVPSQAKSGPTNPNKASHFLVCHERSLVALKILVLLPNNQLKTF
jgi:hypothetical protein